MKIRSLFAFLALAVLLSSGCSQPKPEGLPDLNPLTITLKQDGKAFDGAVVTLYPQSPDNKWACGGTSDASGKVVVMTQGSYQGVPAGSYNVSVMKDVSENLPKSSDDPPADVYLLLEKKFTDPSTSGLTIDVTAGKNNVELDVSPAVKEKQ